MKSAHWRVLPRTALFAACLTSSLAACDGGEGDEATGETAGETAGDTGGDTGGEQGLGIVGDYVDDFMTEHSITEDQWSFAGSNFAIVEYNNDEMWIVAQNDETNQYNPGQWSRFDWTWDGDQLYYCQSVYDGATIDDAKNGGADRSDLQTGCGMFSWSMLTSK